MGKREEDQGARAIRCALGILLGGLLALGVCLAAVMVQSGGSLWLLPATAAAFFTALQKVRGIAGSSTE